MPVDTSFSIAAVVEGGVPVSPGTQPNYIQFRYNGVDLGGPDATVVDFVGDALVVVRGTGPTADIITVSFG